MNNFIKIIIIFIAYICFGCSYHINKNMYNFKKIKYIILKNYNSSDLLMRIIKRQIKSYNILIEENNNKFKNKKYLILKIKYFKIKKKYKLFSILKKNENIEHNYIFILKLYIITPNKNIYPILIKINKTFFENPLLILQKNSSKNFLFKEIYKQIAEIIFNKILKIYSYIE
ncbi:hypothetical protein [Sodalis-like secondary symbiont of Drepanosiphum platanoidis]|uniref:hypothetical protein n=1 Tax=Sodalis-like secondary symbiont of Drepanosiphum platanoidis TaxID=2994493 RepID=UPI003464C45E